MTEHYNGYTITLGHDQDAESPLAWTTPEERRAWYALAHRRYALPFEIDADPDEYVSWTDVAETYCRADGGLIYKFVHWYEHNGVAVSLRDDEGGCGWDGGIAGVIFGETAAAIAATFAEWKAYVEGDVYTASVTAPEGNEVDRFVGLYGYDEALGCAHWTIEEDAKLIGTARIRRYGRAHAPRAQEVHV